jgi:hypothetical protein
MWSSTMWATFRNLWRRLVLPKQIEKGSLTNLQQRLMKSGGRLAKHARRYWMLLAKSHLTRRLFGAMVCRIAVLPTTGWSGDCVL